MLDRLACMPERVDFTQSLYPREEIVQGLEWAFRRGITKPALAALLNRATADKSLTGDITAMLQDVDDPDAMEFVLRQMAEKKWDLGKKLTSISDSDPETVSLCPATVQRLLALWESLGESDGLRSRAFSMWLRATGCRDLNMLQEIDRQSPLFTYALQHRVKLRDRSAVSELLIELRARTLNGFWWELAHRLWCDELRDYAAPVLVEIGSSFPTDFSGGFSNAAFALSKFLVMIPREDAEGLLEAHWDALKYSPTMIHAAFRIGTAKSVALAQQALAICPANLDVFELLTSLWRRPRLVHPATVTHFQNLEPYLDRMTPQQLLFFAGESEREVDPDGKIAQWIRKHIVPRLPAEDRAKVRVADEFVPALLNRDLLRAETHPTVGFILGDLQNDLRFQKRYLKLLDTWLKEHPTLGAFQLVAHVLEQIGSRNDLSLLDRYTIEGDPVLIAGIRANATFAIYRRSLV